MHAITAQGRRVRRHTPDAAQGCIDRQLEANLRHFARHPEGIGDRLRQLEREWDIERTLEANAATVSLASIAFHLVTGRRTHLLAGVVAAFLLQHAIQGWCPPLPFFRRRGVRSKDEILQEAFGLRLLRAGLERIPDLHQAEPDERARILLEVLTEDQPAAAAPPAAGQRNGPVPERAPATAAR